MQNPIIKSLLAVVAGLITAMIVVGIVESAGHMLFPPPEGLDLTKLEDQAKLMHVIPFAAKIAVVLAWFLGALAGSGLAIFISREARAGWIVGAIMIALSLWTTQIFPHPWWMVGCALILPFVAVALAQRLLAKRITP